MQAVVAPGLRREGIVIHVPHQKPSNWRTILTEHHISDKILHEAGFVLFKDFRPSDDSECLDWPIVRGDNKIQMLHRDHPRHHGVAFFYAPQKTFIPRQSFTVLGDSEDVLRGIIAFIRRHDQFHPTEKDTVIGQLLLSLQKNPQLAPDSMSPNPPLTWARYFFNHTGTSLNGIAPQVMQELYDSLKSVTYRHRWEAGDLLMLSEDTVIHGRLPFSLQQEAGQSGLIVKSLKVKSDGRLDKV